MPLFGGHSSSNRFDFRARWIEIAFDREGGDLLPARLHSSPSSIDVAGRRRAPELLFEFAAGDGERILALVIFALGDRPGAMVLLRPERTAGMHEQQLERRPASPRYSKMPALRFVMRPKLNAKKAAADGSYPDGGL